MTTCEEIEDMGLVESVIGSIGPEDKFCVFCGKVLDIDLDYENSCRECE